MEKVHFAYLLSAIKRLGGFLLIVPMMNTSLAIKMVKMSPVAYTVLHETSVGIKD